MPLIFTHDWAHSLNYDKVENKKLQNYTKTRQSMQKHYQWRDVHIKGFRVVVSLSVTSHPPPPPIESGGVPMLVSYHLISPISGKKYTPYLSNW